MFKREERYYVLKLKDLVSLYGEVPEVLDEILREVTFERAIKGKLPLGAVIVEQDWPEYEKVWEMIETRVKNDAKISTCTDPANMV